MIRYIDAEGETISEMREAARKSALYAQGDMKLVWVNEGDITAHLFHVREVMEGEE